jgi:hypothetical protein
MATTDRDEAIKTIRAALKRRSGKAWSVRGGTGSAWGWITITAPPLRLDRDGRMLDKDIAELSQLLGMSVPPQGVKVAARANYWREYIDRAEGRTPSVDGTPYQD